MLKTPNELFIVTNAAAPTEPNCGQVKAQRCCHNDNPVIATHCGHVGHVEQHPRHGRDALVVHALLGKGSVCKLQ
jgi:hypothetical protein